MIQGKWLLVGHRGVGKSTFLRGLKEKFAICLDLDDEIEKRSKKKIPEIFELAGTEGFRQVEAATLQKILDEQAKATSIVIALGAGFEGRIWPRDYRCLWLRKESDIWPRYFFDRPVVGTSSPSDFLSAYIEREKRYQDWADLGWTLDEGFGQISQDIRWPLEQTLGDRAYLTLVPRLHKNPLASIELRRPWNPTFELRTDLWSMSQIKDVFAKSDLAATRFLLSIRTTEFDRASVIPRDQSVPTDWEISLGEPKFSPEILSLHNFSGGLQDGLRRLGDFSRRYPHAHLKASPVIESLDELKFLYQWQQTAPDQRSIFPRTKITEEHARWQWVRILLCGKQKVNFLREASEGIKDQPTIQQFCDFAALSSPRFFAAVAGDPIAHSFSPLFHRDFFAAKNMAFVALPLASSQVYAETFKFLEELGLRALAITSPLKSNTALLVASSPGEAAAENVCNTLVHTPSGWQRFNTDQQSLQDLPAGAWRIWGAGAVARQFFAQCENAELYSARKGECVERKGVVSDLKFNLLWCAGNEVGTPPESWRPQKVFDLSYLEKSEGLLYAIQNKLDYENGLEFFKKQAVAQQRHWKVIGDK